MAREHRREKAPARRGGSGAAAAAAPAASEPSGGSGSVAGEAVNENDEELPRTFVHSYCAMDYGRMVDVASLRLHRLRRRLKDAVQNRRGPQVCAARLPCKAAARAAETRALHPARSLRSGQRSVHASPARLNEHATPVILLSARAVQATRCCRPLSCEQRCRQACWRVVVLGRKQSSAAACSARLMARAGARAPGTPCRSTSARPAARATTRYRRCR